MKVYIVVDAKKNGKTDKITKQFIQGAQSAGHEVETEYLFMKKNTHGCIDCQPCKRNGGSCVWNDDITPMLESDILVFASPVYFFSISSQLKQFMDRAYAVMEKIKNKKFYFITTAEGPSDIFEEDLRRVTEPIQGFLDCFDRMEFIKTLSFFDTGSKNVVESDDYKEAKAIGASV